MRDKKQVRSSKKPLKVLFVEPNLSHTSPVSTLAKAINKEGGSIQFLNFDTLSTKDLIKHYFKVDVLVIQFYGVIDDYARKQIALAVLMGVAVVRNWAGTDVLKSLTVPKVTLSTKYVNKLVSVNITTTHVGLVVELNSIGIDCKLTTQLFDYGIACEKEVVGTKSLGVMAYLPTDNQKFYGSKFMENLIIKFPQLTFVIVADNEHLFAKYSNVESVGKVKNMEPLWEKVGLLVRITEHDGYPRMNLEALLRGKYVIHNNKLPGVWFAETNDEIEAAVQSFIEQSEPNYEGIEIVKKMLNSGGEKDLYWLYSKARVRVRQRMMALKELAKFYIRAKR